MVSAAAQRRSHGPTGAGMDLQSRVSVERDTIASHRPLVSC